MRNARTTAASVAAIALLAAIFAGVALRSSQPAEAVCSNSLNYGDIADCSLSVSGEQDSFTFSGLTGEKVLVRLREITTALTPKFTVRSPNGMQLCTGIGTSETQGECVLTMPGVHTIVVESAPVAAGDYRLYLARTSSPTTQPPTAIAYGDVVSGSIAAMKWYPYTFTAALNEKVVVRVREVDATLNPHDVAPWAEWGDCVLGAERQ